MYRYCLIVPVVLVLTPSVPAAEPPPDAARKAWAVTEVVLERNVKPPTRAAMVLSGLRGLLEAAKAEEPADLAKRAEGVTSEKQLAGLLGELWPTPPKEETDLEDALLTGMMRAVPGFGRVIPQEEVKINEQITFNRYVGTGIQIRSNMKEGLTEVVATFTGSPARKAGMKAGDLILEVDGVSLKGESLRRVVELLRGPEGSELTVVVRQPDSTEERKLKMVRSVVPFETAVGFRRVADEEWGYRVDEKSPIAYVRITGIKVSTLHELRRLEKKMRDDGCKALVLDLRMNFGSTQVEDAALLADGLLDGGVLWRVRGKGEMVKEYRADRDCLFRDWPLAILTDEQTAGTPVNAFVVALQDRGRAVVVGTGPRAEGLVRTVVPLPGNLGAINLATGILERVGKRQDLGLQVKPDHPVAMEGKAAEALREWFFLQERSAPDALTTKAPEDPQLAKAVEVLQAAIRKEK